MLTLDRPTSWAAVATPPATWRRRRSVPTAGSGGSCATGRGCSLERRTGRGRASLAAPPVYVDGVSPRSSAVASGGEAPPIVVVVVVVVAAFGFHLGDSLVFCRCLFFWRTCRRFGLRRLAAPYLYLLLPTVPRPSSASTAARARTFRTLPASTALLPPCCRVARRSCRGVGGARLGEPAHRRARGAARPGRIFRRRVLGQLLQGHPLGVAALAQQGIFVGGSRPTLV